MRSVDTEATLTAGAQTSVDGSLRLVSNGPQPAVLLIPNLAWWVIGAMAKEIIKVGRERFDFYLLTESLLAKRPDLAAWLVSRMSLVHALNETGVQPLRQVVGPEGPPVVTWIHHVTAWSADHQAAVENSRMITVCTEEWAGRIREFRPDAPPVCVVPHGVDSEFFHRVPPERAKFGIPAGSFAVGFVASKDSNKDNNRKGVDTLLQVIERLRQRVGNLHVSFVGTGWDEEAGALRVTGVSASAVKFLPKRLLPAFYSSIDVYLMTSRVEGGPCTVLESMACETPVVATRVGLVPAVVVDGVNSYSADCDDVQGLTDALVSVAQSKDYRKRLGIDARRTILQNQRWQVTLPVLLNAYNGLSMEWKPGQTQPPKWFRKPNRFVGAALAADALLWLWRRFRLGEISLLMAIRRAPAMLEGLVVPDILRGLGMLTGLMFRIPS
jgi:glycosyltransferase involved in cell wall biosynthesis